MMYKMRAALGVPLTAGLLGAVLVSAPATTSVASPTPPPVSGGPKIFSGTLVGQDGEPVSDAKIEVMVQKEIPEGHMMTRIATSRTLPNGKFTVHGKLAKSPRTVEGGEITLEVNVSSPTAGFKAFNLDIRPPAAGRADWTWGEVVDHNLLPNGKTQTAPGLARRPLSGLELSMGSEDGDVADGVLGTPLSGEQGKTDTFTQAPVTTAASDPGDGGYCYTGNYYWKWVPDTWRFRWTPQARIIRLNRSKQTYYWDTTAHSKEQAAYVVSQGFKGQNFAGGFVKATESNTDTDAKLSFGGSRTSNYKGQVQARWRWQKQTKMCFHYWEDGQTTTSYSGLSRWYPKRWDSGNRDVKDGVEWKCPRKEYTTKIDGLTGYKKGGTTTFTNVIEIASVRLDNSQTNSTSTYRTIAPANGFDKARVCGSNAEPSAARQQREIGWRWTP